MGAGLAAQHIERTQTKPSTTHLPIPHSILRAGHRALAQRFLPEGFQPKVLLRVFSLPCMSSQLSHAQHRWCMCTLTNRELHSVCVGFGSTCSSRLWARHQAASPPGAGIIPSCLERSLSLDSSLLSTAFSHRHSRNNCTACEITQQQLTQPTVYFALSHTHTFSFSFRYCAWSLAGCSVMMLNWLFDGAVKAGDSLLCHDAARSLKVSVGILQGMPAASAGSGSAESGVSSSLRLQPQSWITTQNAPKAPKGRIKQNSVPSPCHQLVNHLSYDQSALVFPRR